MAYVKEPSKRRFSHTPLGARCEQHVIDVHPSSHPHPPQRPPHQGRHQCLAYGRAVHPAKRHLLPTPPPHNKNGLPFPWQAYALESNLEVQFCHVEPPPPPTSPSGGLPRAIAVALPGPAGKVLGACGGPACSPGRRQKLIDTSPCSSISKTILLLPSSTCLFTPGYQLFSRLGARLSLSHPLDLLVNLQEAPSHQPPPQRRGHTHTSRFSHCHGSHVFCDFCLLICARVIALFVVLKVPLLPAPFLVPQVASSPTPCPRRVLGRPAPSQ